MTYLDHAATSFPKPVAVVEAVRDYLLHRSANPGRSGHSLSAQAARVVFETRVALAELLGAGDPRQIIFLPNATYGINLALNGYLRDGDHVVVSSLEHNSVMRPLRHLRQLRRLKVTTVLSDDEGVLDPQRFADAMRAETRLVVVNHASNVVGTIAPLTEIREAIGEVPLLVDAAQTAGAVPIDVAGDRIDMLAFAGHKSLLGPQGVGGLYVRPGLDVRPLVFGGTGSGSESDEQPSTLPDFYESGTPNGPGIAGLGAGVRYVQQRGIGEIRQHEQALFTRLRNRLSDIPGVTLSGPADPAKNLPVVSLGMARVQPSELAHVLDRRFGVLTRAGLHCAPEAHRSLGTFPHGSVRLSAGCATSLEEIDRAADAVAEIAAEVSR
jgi:cysteine desulfurase family protein